MNVAHLPRPATVVNLQAVQVYSTGGDRLHAYGMCRAHVASAAVRPQYCVVTC